ncbi:putative signaling protein [Cupriavidus sp. TA19]|nr:bifunctional diguanylate cyclase/phosphodiesterase [Cupriavidus sp. P-10]GLC92565.1 putative signaling protein [Cupriavidus sp. TA19]
MLAPRYDNLLVLFSVLVAAMASYTALTLVSRLANARGSAAQVWLAAGSVVMGLGIWSMHFIGMLALQLPIPLGYDLPLTAYSLLIAVAASGFALRLVCTDTLPWRRLALGAVLMGGAVAGMHYTGMAAMRMHPAIDYDPLLVALSIVVAVSACGTALWMAFQLRHHGRHTTRLRLGAAGLMGLATASMHYIGMAAARFAPGSVCGAADTGLAGDELALPILVITICVLAMALVTAMQDLRVEARTAALASSLAAARQELGYLALHDKLTKLPNRALLEDRFEQALQAAARHRQRMAVLFINLDGFKGINDSFGHHVGDHVLAEAARRIGANLGTDDIAGRLGGDEIVLLTVIEAPEEASALAMRLLDDLREPLQVGAKSLQISASIGIAIYPDDGTGQRTLLRNADAAMHHAKASGRDSCCFFTHAMNNDAQARLELAQDLRLALTRNEFELHYQPKIAASDGSVLGAEALLRWRHPRRGLLMPDQFIGLAEKSGLILQIGAWALDEACAQLARWHAAGRSQWTIAVNLSAVQFGHPSLIDTVHAAIEKHRLDPRALTVEVTESTAMRDMESSLAILRQLDEMGVRIAIDDFGTGHSSLLYLKRMPAKELKIDRDFVRDLARDSGDAAIVAAIIALGRTLNLTIVAEGIETAAQQATLTRLGCDVLQGYLIGGPVPAEAFPAPGPARPCSHDHPGRSPGQTASLSTVLSRLTTPSENIDIPATNAGTPISTNSAGIPTPNDNIVAPPTDPTTEPMRPTPLAQLTPVARQSVG